MRSCSRFYMLAGTAILLVLVWKLLVICPARARRSEAGCWRSMLAARNRVDCMIVLVFESSWKSGECGRRRGGDRAPMRAVRNVASEEPACVNPFGWLTRARSFFNHSIIHCRPLLHHSDEAPPRTPTYSPNTTANMSDDEERVTMPFKFVTGMMPREFTSRVKRR